MSLAHQKSKRRRLQRWTTPAMVAAYYGVCTRTVRRWIQRIWVEGTAVHGRHYTDERERKTDRGQWRIFERDLLALLKRMRVKGKPGFGPGFWKGVG